MGTHGFATFAAIVSLALPVAAPAQDGEGATGDLDLTIRLMPEGAEDGGEVTRTITLPANVPERVPRTVPGEDAGAGDGDGAPDAPGRPEDAGPPERGDAPGRDVAEQARSGETGRELGQELRERALDNREEAERGDGPPDGVPAPETPGPGDTGGPPGDGPGQGDTPRPETPGDDVPDTDGEVSPDTPSDAAGGPAEAPDQDAVPGGAGP